MSSPLSRRGAAAVPPQAAQAVAPVRDEEATSEIRLTRRELRARQLTSSGAAAAQPTETVTPAHAVIAAVAVAAESIVADAVEEAPVVVDETPVVVDEAPAVTDEKPTADAFAAASRLFAEAEAEAPVSTPPAATDDADDADEPAAQASASVSHVAPRRKRGFANMKRVTATSLSVGVVGCVLALTVAMAFPAAPAGNSTERAAASALVDEGEIQAFVASSDVKNSDVERSANYETVTAAQIAQETGINFSSEVFSNDPSAAIQWPFKVGTGMSYGYGMRDGRLHEGIDFTPGSGAPIQAIADGTVREATENGGNYGVTVYIDHVIDGQTITSHYSHMQVGSLKVAAGDVVKVGDTVGLTGNTGRSFGAHLHFELIVNGATIDPLPWLKSHAG